MKASTKNYPLSPSSRSSTGSLPEVSIPVAPILAVSPTLTLEGEDWLGVKVQVDCYVGKAKVDLKVLNSGELSYEACEIDRDDFQGLFRGKDCKVDNDRNMMFASAGSFGRPAIQIYKWSAKQGSLRQLNYSVWVDLAGLDNLRKHLSKAPR